MTLKTPSQNKPDETLNKVVDWVLNQIFGQVAAQIIYYYLENKHSIKRHEIAEKFDSFNRALEEYLGIGAMVVEKVILENLELRGFEEKSGIDFTERQRLLKLA